MSVIYGHPVMAAARALRFSDHVTKRNGGSGDENVHQQEKLYDMRSWTVSRKHLLQSNYCKLFGWISSSDAKFLAHICAKKEEWDTAESSTVLIFSLSSCKWQKYVFFCFFAVLSRQRRWYRKTETVKLEICLLVSWIMKVWRPRLIALEVVVK